MPDRYTLQDPTKQYPKPKQKFEQHQQGPGLEKDMPVKPEAGEQTYRGTGRLTGRKAALHHMPAGSTIINTVSVEAYKPSPILLDCATTKGAITTFSKALAGQVASKGIRVNVVAPGPIWTPLQVSGGQQKEKLGQFGEQTPLGRPAQPAELAPAYVFPGLDRRWINSKTNSNLEVAERKRQKHSCSKGINDQHHEKPRRFPQLGETKIVLPCTHVFALLNTRRGASEFLEW